MKLRIPLALAAFIIATLATYPLSAQPLILDGDLTITDESELPESRIIETDTPNRYTLTWGSIDSPVQSTMDSITGLSTINLVKDSSLTVTGTLSAFTVWADCELIFDGAYAEINDLYTLGSGVIALQNGASADIGSYMLIGGKVYVNDASLTLAAGPQGVKDSVVGAKIEGSSLLEIGEGGVVTAQSGLAIGYDYDPDDQRSRSGTVTIKEGGQLVVNGEALRIGAGRSNLGYDGTSGTGSLIIDGGSVITDELYAGKIQTLYDDVPYVGQTNTYIDEEGQKAYILITNGGTLDVTNGEAGYRTVLGHGTTLEATGSATLATTSDSISNPKWFVAESGSSFILQGNDVQWNHAYMATFHSGSTFRMLDGATADVFYLSFACDDGLIQGTKENQTVLTLGDNVIGWSQNADSVVGSTTGAVLTIGEYATLNAEQGLSIGHRSTNVDSRDGSVFVLENGEMNVSNQALRVGAGRTATTDGSSGNGQLSIQGIVTADELIVGDFSSAAIGGDEPGEGIVELTEGGWLEVLGTATFGSGASFQMDSQSSVYVSQLDLNGGITQLGGYNYIETLNLSDEAALVLYASTASIGNGAILDVGTINGITEDSQIDLEFDVSNEGIDLLGKTINMIKTEDGVLGLGDIFIGEESDIASSYETDGIELFFTLTTSGQIVFDSSLITTHEVTQNTELKSEITLGSIHERANNYIFTSDEGETTVIGTNIFVYGGELEAYSEKITQYDTSAALQEDGRTKVTLSETEVAADLLTLAIRENVTIAGQSDQASVGLVDGEHTLNRGVITSDASLTLGRSELYLDQKLTAYSGSAVNLRGYSQLVIGGSDAEFATEEYAAAVAKSKIDGSSLFIIEGSILRTEKVENASTTSLDISNSTIDLGNGIYSSGGIIEAGSGTEINIDQSVIAGYGIMSGLNVSNSRVTAGHSPGILTLSGGTYSNSILEVFIVGDNIISGGMNNNPSLGVGNISQFKIEGVVTFDNVIFNIAWEGADDSSLLTQGTEFQFLDLSEGTVNGNVITGTLPALTGNLVWDLTSLTTSGVASVALSQIGEGQRIANAMWSSGQVVSSLGTTAMRHVNDYRTKDNNVWVSGLGNFADISNHNGRTGYDYQGGGYAVGYDRTLNNPDFILGIAFGQTFGENKPNRGTERYSAGKIEQDAIMGALYGKQVLSRNSDKHMFWLENYISYGVVDNDSSKNALYNNTLSSSNASWDDQVWSAGIKAVCSHNLDNGYTVSPFVGMDYIHVSQDDITETMGTSSARYLGGSYQSWTLSAGVTVDRKFDFVNGMQLRPALTAAYLGDVSRNTPTVDVINGTTRTREHGVNPGRNGLLAAFNLDWRIDAQWGARVGYEVEARSGMTSQTAHLGVNYSF